MIRAMLLAAITALPAAAQEVGECDWRASAANLQEPWGAPDVTRSFANGEVRLAVLDAVEPAAGAFYLMVLSPPYDELGIRQCRIVAETGGMGFAGMTLVGVEASYDPATGLTFAVPVTLYRPETADFDEGRRLRITLNQATGAIAARTD